MISENCFNKNHTKLLLFLITLVVTISEATTQIGRYDTGKALGMIPYCPGVEKNSILSPSLLAEFKIINFSLNTSIYANKNMRILEAPEIIKRHKLFDFKKKTIVIITAFHDTAYYPQNQIMATEYSNRGYNVIMADTYKVFVPFMFTKCARLTKEVGKRLGEFLAKLTKQGLHPENVQMIALSLGAHVMAFAGKQFYKITGKKVFRLTGLDPAGSCFKSLPPELRLDASDGERVDVIHTNIEGLGMPNRMGHIDFYVNGGEYQLSDLMHYPCGTLCSHFKAFLYWWQSLKHQQKFIALKCDTIQDARNSNCYNSTVTNYLGPKTDFTKPGIYFLSTTNIVPYYKGKDGLIKEKDVSYLFFEHSDKNVFPENAS